MKNQKLPVTDSIEELARFWDTHDATDYWDEFEEVKEPIFDPNLRTAMVISLEPGEVKAIDEAAKARGVERGALIRQWILEKLQESTISEATADDEIIREVRAIREAYAEEFGFNIRALFEDAKRREGEGGRKVVSLGPKIVAHEETEK